MKQFSWVLCTGILAINSAAHAQAPELPPMPPMPMMDGIDNLDDPALLSPDPFAAPEPITPLNADSTGDKTEEPFNDAASGLAPINNPDEFNFFQPGAQLPDLPPLPSGPVGTLPPENSQPTITITQPKAEKNIHKRPLRKRFNYKIQRLPSAIYSEDYAPKNRHLPVAQYEAQYDAATFAAAASNNLDGLRAMIEHGGRSLEMRNAQGYTLVEVATYYRAHAALRYLLAIGAPQGAAHPTDSQSYYALNAAR